MTNTLKNYASLTGGNFAVYGTSGNETVNNYNLITANVFLGSGTNAFFNRAGATFRSGPFVSVGAGNTLTEAGDLSPGGTGNVVTTTLIGKLVQTGTGTFTVDLDQAGAGADHVTVSETADFAGKVVRNVISLVTPSGSVMIADASAVTNTATAVDNTPTVDFSLSVIGGNELWLNWAPALLANLLTVPLTPNEKATADYIDAITIAGAPPSLQSLINTLKGLGDQAAIVAALDRLHPEHYLAQVEDTLQSSLFFANSLMSCPTTNGAYAVIAEGQCVWARVGGRTFKQDRTNTNIGGDTDAWNVSGGAEVILQGNWRLGFAGSYEQSDLKTNNRRARMGSRPKRRGSLRQCEHARSPTGLGYH